MPKKLIIRRQLENSDGSMIEQQISGHEIANLMISSFQEIIEIPVEPRKFIIKRKLRQPNGKEVVIEQPFDERDHLVRPSIQIDEIESRRITKPSKIEKSHRIR
ncbi:hypothetical protein DERP_012404 [Dermatophagoides pteronyssinus]|uniref:Uncharacterized protein n=1 Tax=Dermatophagoides pteronyssinus TaxID=6956 RepID=A0ABQ8IUM6_DERPT|nr:hypothetical protein DERP_012404 [Dermatophagoides pteronyssinus]